MEKHLFFCLLKMRIKKIKTIYRILKILYGDKAMDLVLFMLFEGNLERRRNENRATNAENKKKINRNIEMKIELYMCVCACD